MKVKMGTSCNGHIGYIEQDVRKGLDTRVFTIEYACVTAEPFLFWRHFDDWHAHGAMARSYGSALSVADLEFV
jgi:hypothetical protein